MRIWRSVNEGASWEVHGGLIDVGSSGYSSLQQVGGATEARVALLYEQSDANDLADDIVMTPDRFVFRLL
jgi:hypothetical protein